ncbi:MAG TPA: DNA translocase FtsK 4TM domain-containing protein [Kiritimatiellia bacterium]|nr:DNA translocase FtsK 4TM domain-containing protein [Kiritimatiellia bacterium]
MAVKKEVIHTGWRELGGMLLIAGCILGMLSLMSYEWKDIPSLHEPPNRPPVNFIGPTGAWFSFLTLGFFGIPAYLLPAGMAYIGLLCIFKREGRVWPKAGWMFGLLAGLAVLFEFQSGGWDGLILRLNLTAGGGLLGEAFGSRILANLVGTVGAGIIALALIVTSIIMMIDVHPMVLWAAAREKSATAWKALDAWRLARLDRTRQLEEEEKELAKRRMRLEKAMKAQAREDAETARKTRKSQPAPQPDDLDDEPPDQTPARKRLSLFKRQRDDDHEQETTPPVIEPPRPSEPLRKPPRKSPPEPLITPADADDPPLGSFGNPDSLFKLPSYELLESLPIEQAPVPVSDLHDMGILLKETLSEFGIDVEVTNVERGPVVTRFELLPAPGVRVEKITGLSANIALAMKAESIRVQAPIPGKGVVGIELPNSTTTTVYFREVVESPGWQSGKAALPLALGKDVGGHVLIADLADMPHLLIAGSTGSGKTVCMNSILTGLLMARTPDEMKLMLVDPKIVEFATYNHLPHLVVPVITDPKKVSHGLRWAINEMERRYKLFAKAGVRNIKGFNSRPIVKQASLFEDELPPPDPSPADTIPDRVPYIVIVIDELADLMLAAQAEIENSIARLAQLSRAVGIHMIIATQRPSVNVITGTIKANFPARISFQVAQKVDSRTILDAAGADKLLGKGDMLFLPPGSAKLIRAQGTFTSDAEMNRVVQHIKEQGQPTYESAIKQKIESKSPDIPEMEEDDDMLEQAIEIIRQTKRASTSSLQRRLRIGYTRAARIMDILEEKGIVGPANGADPREILIDLDDEIPPHPENEPPPA